MSAEALLESHSISKLCVSKIFETVFDRRFGKYSPTIENPTYFLYEKYNIIYG